MGINRKQYLFALEYATDYNATQAAIRAGYSENGAQQEGSRLLLNVVIQEAIAEIEQSKLTAIKLTAENILEDIVKTRNAAYEAKQFGVSARCDELLGKILLNIGNKGLRTITSNPDGTVKIEFTQENDKV